jgi:hypothetical protein
MVGYPMRLVRLGWFLFVLFICFVSANVSAEESTLLIPAEVVRLAIDHPKLAVFLHPEVPERVPLVISEHLLKPGIRLRKFSKPVLIVSDSIANTRPSIRFLSFEKKKNEYLVILEYNVQGVTAAFFLTRGVNNVWKLTKAQVVET